MVRICGASLALLAFSVSILRGMAVGNPTDVILIRALWSLVLFLFLGLTAGWIAETVITEHNRLLDEKEAEQLAAAAAKQQQESEDSSESEDVEAEVPEGAGANAT